MSEHWNTGVQVIIYSICQGGDRMEEISDDVHTRSFWTDECTPVALNVSCSVKHPVNMDVNTPSYHKRGPEEDKQEDPWRSGVC